MKTKVRGIDHMVFEVWPNTLAPKTTVYYDPWCYSGPEPDTIYIEEHEWYGKRKGK